MALVAASCALGSSPARLQGRAGGSLGFSLRWRLCFSPLCSPSRRWRPDAGSRTRSRTAAKYSNHCTLPRPAVPAGDREAAFMTTADRSLYSYGSEGGHARRVPVRSGNCGEQRSLEGKVHEKAPDRFTWSGAVHLRWVWDLNPRRHRWHDGFQDLSPIMLRKVLRCRSALARFADQRRLLVISTPLRTGDRPNLLRCRSHTPRLSAWQFPHTQVSTAPEDGFRAGS